MSTAYPNAGFPMTEERKFAILFAALGLGRMVRPTRHVAAESEHQAGPEGGVVGGVVEIWRLRISILILLLALRQCGLEQNPETKSSWAMLWMAR